MELEYQLPNGNWVDAGDRAETFLDRVLQREPWFAPRVHREPMTTRQQVLDYLATSAASIHHGDEWYALIRAKPAPAPNLPSNLVHCDCGHDCERVAVMSASWGSACPDCYDRMSK